MFKSLLILLGLAFVSSTSFAATGINGTTTFCSGIQTTSSILGSPLSLSCSGDFALSGRTIADSFGVFLSSTSALTLDNISITAPAVSFSAGTLFSMTPSALISAANALISAANASISANTIAMNGTISVPGGALSITSPFYVPSATVSGATLFVSSGSLNPGGGGTGSLNPGGGGTLTISAAGGNLINTATGGVLSGATLISPVPEPSSSITLLLGLLCLAGLQSRNRINSLP